MSFCFWYHGVILLMFKLFICTPSLTTNWKNNGPWWALRKLHLVLTIFLVPKNLATKQETARWEQRSEEWFHSFILVFLYQLSLEAQKHVSWFQNCSMNFRKEKRWQSSLDGKGVCELPFFCFSYHLVKIQIFLNDHQTWNVGFIQNPQQWSLTNLHKKVPSWWTQNEPLSFVLVDSLIFFVWCFFQNKWNPSQEKRGKRKQNTMSLPTKGGCV